MDQLMSWIGDAGDVNHELADFEKYDFEVELGGESDACDELGELEAGVLPYFFSRILIASLITVSVSPSSSWISSWM
jgi:hypothetical protein